MLLQRLSELISANLFRKCLTWSICCIKVHKAYMNWINCRIFINIKCDNIHGRALNISNNYRNTTYYF